MKIKTYLKENINIMISIFSIIMTLLGMLFGITFSIIGLMLGIYIVILKDNKSETSKILAILSIIINIVMISSIVLIWNIVLKEINIPLLSINIFTQIPKT